MGNIVIGLGNTGYQIIKVIANDPVLNDVKLYAIDSVATDADLDIVNRVNIIPIISDDVSGSGRNRDRGAEMFIIHENDGAFDQMYKDIENAKEPVLIITSSAGGTGSGSCVPLCKSLVAKGITPIPIIITPNMSDPDAYHLNTNDLFAGLGEIVNIVDGMAQAGVPSYSIFQNPKNTANYDNINKDVVNLVEIILGKRYKSTDADSIDESDLLTVLRTPGRFIAVSAKATNVDILRKEITKKVFSGYQPAWSNEDASKYTLMTAYALSSMFAGDEFDTVFEDIRKRIPHWFDEYRNIAPLDTDGMSEAIVIISGLPRTEVKDIDTEYNLVDGLGEGIKKSVRPSFIKRSKIIPQASVNKKPTGSGVPSTVSAKEQNGDADTLKKYNLTE